MWSFGGPALEMHWLLPAYECDQMRFRVQEGFRGVAVGVGRGQPDFGVLAVVALLGLVSTLVIWRCAAWVIPTRRA